MLWVPADRIVEIMDACPRQPWHSGHVTRRMNELRMGRQKFVSIDTAFGILCEVDLEYLLHVPREDGGLADIYVDGMQYGAPNRGGSHYGTLAEIEEAKRLRRNAKNHARSPWRHPVPRACLVCGEEYEPAPGSSNARRLYCSRRCNAVASARRRKAA